MSRAIASAFAIHSLSLLLAANAVASTQPGDKPLSEILVPVEAHGTVISADQGRNRWEVVVCERIGNCTEVYLDRATGQELRRERENDIERELAALCRKAARPRNSKNWSGCRYPRQCSRKCR